MLAKISSHRRTFLLAGLLMAAAFPSLAASSRADVKAQAAAALAQVKAMGVDAAIKDFNDHPEKWKKDDLTLIVADLQGVVKAHVVSPQLVGRNVLELKDQNGKFFVKEYVAAAKAGEGWVDNEWPSATTKKIETREVYVKAIPGTELFLGVGRVKN